MNPVEDVIARLAAADTCGYHAGGICATEPAALTALALLAADRVQPALLLVDWLLAQQTVDGSVGVVGDQAAPGWGTPWTILAWQAASLRLPDGAKYDEPSRQALDWLLTSHGAATESSAWIEHDTAADGWPWVSGTHAWVEPTAMSLLALRCAGHGDHPRAREAARLLENRLLANGGCNYGNTVVLGQELLPHLQPTGLCLLALAGEPDPRGRIAKSISYLECSLSAQVGTSSLCYGLLGLAAHGAFPTWGVEALATVTSRTIARDPAAYKLALLALALPGPDSPLVRWNHAFPASPLAT